MRYFCVFLLFAASSVTAQRLKKSDKEVIDHLQKEIGYLSSDQLQGRRTGSEGEKLAYQYLSAQFEKAGLEPEGDDHTYLQTFTIDEGKQVLPATHLLVNDSALQTGKDFFPLAFSADGKARGDVSPAFKEKGMPWFWDLKDVLKENGNNPHFDLIETIRNRAIDYAKKGASALIIYHSGKDDDGLQFDAKSKAPPVPIPVIYLTKEVAARYLSDEAANLTVDLQVALGSKTRTGHNVIGYIDNKAPHTIILGAHYDHLGLGEDDNSLDPGNHAVHNGADDNASGTAAMIELAKAMKGSRLDKNNYLFICFSGEELGLLGSKYFIDHSPVPLGQVDYMINCDMIGRLNDQTKKLIVGGFGTSPEWSRALPEKTKSLTVQFDSSGVGPSDHTSFYLKGIPVLFFFTGMEPDYHKATDDADKINYVGEYRVIQYIEEVLKATNNDQKIAFSKTREPQMVAAHFSVTLGFMPDYSYQGNGVRVDETIDGKTAQHAGMKAGDVITRLGDYPVTDLNTYMQALGKFKKGDATVVTVMRGPDEMHFDVVF